MVQMVSIPWTEFFGIRMNEFLRFSGFCCVVFHAFLTKLDNLPQICLLLEFQGGQALQALLGHQALPVNKLYLNRKQNTKTKSAAFKPLLHEQFLCDNFHLTFLDAFVGKQIDQFLYDNTICWRTVGLVFMQQITIATYR